MKLLDHTSQRSSLRQPVALVAFGIVAAMAIGLAGCGSSSDSRQRNSELTPTDIACADGGACVAGDTGPGGGIVFITPATEGNTRADYYLEAAPLNGLAAENCREGSKDTGIGEGKSNTEKALTLCSPNDGLNAIQLVDDLVFNGLDDWFLPSQNELVALSQSKDLFVCPENGLCSTNFTAETYWSSTYSAGDQPIALNFAIADSQPVAADGASNFGVRPVRAFSTLPAAPTDVVGITGQKSVPLKWTEPLPNGSSAITSYKVLQSSNGGSTWIPGVLGADKTVTGLKDGTSYSFKVAAVNKMGTGEYSEPSKQVRTELAPCAPSSAEVGTNTVLTFSAEESCTWIVPAGVTSIDTLVVGGGAGGANQGAGAGGGGGGSMLNGIAVEPGANIVTTVGQGGVGATSGPDVAAGNGFDSSLLIGEREIAVNGGAGFFGGNAYFIGGDAGKSGYSNYFSGQKIVYGAGGSTAANTTAATAATSSGNGGSTVADNTAGGAGGSGVVVIRYATDPLNAFPASFGTPFARYVAGDYQSEDTARTAWVDSSGNGRAAVDVTGAPKIEVGTGNGATGNIVAVAGGTGDAVTFPDAVLPQKYTLFHVSRYAGENQGRIIASNKGDWYSGFVDGQVGVAKHNSVMKDDGGESHSNWLLSSDQNAVYRANGVQVSTKTNGMSFKGPLTVNGSNGGPKQESDWQVAEVLVYEGELTLAQIQQMENYFARTYGLQGKNAAGVNVGILSTKAIKAKQKDEKSIDLTWTPPTDTTNLDDYVVEFSTDKKIWKLYDHKPTTNNKITVLGLDDVSEYDFRVTPSYADVTNEQTDAGAEAVAIKTIARAPTDVSGVPGDSKVTVSWTAPTATGNTAITRYEVKYSTAVDGRYLTFDDNTIAESPAVVNGLKNGVPYFFKVAAVNTAGPGDDSDPSVAVTPRTFPGVPTEVKSKPDKTGGVDVSWGAPTFDGGSVITAYVVKSCLGTQCSTQETDGGTKKLSLINLEIGKEYTFQVAAKNVAGPGPYSDSKTATTPRVKPGVPVDVVGEAGKAEVALEWKVPEALGGSDITSYTVEICQPGKCNDPVDMESATTEKTFTGLTNGVAYTFRVAATNEAGTGAYSDPSAPVTPRTVPDAPTKLKVEADKAGNLEVKWDVPVFDGGANITDYVIQYLNDAGGGWVDFVHRPSEQKSATLEKLTVGAKYLVRVAAFNIAGAGEFATTTTVVMPRTPPATPTAVAGVPKNKLVDLTWTAPQNNGSDISDYVVRYCVKEVCTTFEDGESAKALAQVKELSNGTEYIFEVAAVNDAGRGEFSAPFKITPRTIPGAPRNVEGKIDNDGKVVVTWKAPADNGGNDITDYIVKSCKGETCSVAADSTTNTVSATLSGLSLRTSYRFIVVAKNDAGTGPDSEKSAPAILQKLPSVPIQPTAVPDKTGGVVVTWIAPDDGGVDIFDYVVEYCDASNECKEFAHTASTSETITVTALTTGSKFTFKVAAKNAAGTGGFSPNSVAVIPHVVPGAPIEVEADANDKGVIALKWEAPKFTGGVPLTGFVVQACIKQNCVEVAQINSAGIAAVSINELIAGTLYTFKVAAKNIAGVGEYSVASAPIAPRSLPGVPRTVAAVANNTGGIRVTWLVPLSNGGIDITGYKIQSCLGDKCSDAATSDGEELAVVVEKLTLGVRVTFQVAAVNAAGQGAYSSPSNGVVPASPPGPPTGLDGTADNTFVNLTWAAPEVTGGFAISDYVVQVCTGGTCVAANDGTSKNTAAKITLLRNGLKYTFTVAAVNSIGTGAASEVSRPITPRTIPGAPTNLSATANFNRQKFVEWKNPTDNGGASITSYRVEWCIDPNGCSYGFFGAAYAPNPQENAYTEGTTLPKVQILNSDNQNTSFKHRVSVKNEAGWGPWSQLSNAVIARSAPNKPDQPLATEDNDGGIELKWTAPSANNEAITDYVIKACVDKECVVINDGVDVFATKIITGLTLGKEYTFTVAATNLAGTSADSSPSIGATPRTVPDAPTVVVATIDDEGKVALSWNAPLNKRGNAISDYAVQSCIDTKCTTVKDAVSPELEATVTGLTNGIAYTFKVAAINAAGTGAYSSGSSSVTPRTVAGVPTGVVGTAENMEVKLEWVVPLNNGGSEITDYTVQSCKGETCVTFVDAVSSLTTTTVTELQNGTAYTFRVAAVNAAKSGAYSKESAPVTPRTVPSAPTAVKGESDNTGGVDVSWTEPKNNGGNAISDYTVESCLTTCTSLTRLASTTVTVAATCAAGGTCRVGDTGPGGGKVFYVAPSNFTSTGSACGTKCKYLEAAPTGWIKAATPAGQTNCVTPGTSTADPKCEWSGNTTTRIGTTSTAIGAGHANTSAMIGQSNVAGKAATVARAFQGGGKTDWYLPSKDELNQAYLQKSEIGSFASVDYWSSSETDANAAWFYGFYGYGDNAWKSVTFSVHPVRAFSDVATVAATTASTTTSVKVTGLTKGTAYTFRVAAINGAGLGGWSDRSGNSTPRSVPEVPKWEKLTPGDREVNLEWVAPPKNGSDITTYVVNSCIDTKCTPFVHDASTETQLSVTGLTNGTAYTFTVAATNGIGTGEASVPSAAITPRTVPGAPTGVTGSIDNDGKVVVTWKAPTDNGGNAIKDYIVKSCVGSTCSVAADSTSNTLSATLSGLSLRTSYTFIVAAKNEAGTGPYSSNSDIAILRKLPSVPNKPTAVPNTTGGVVVTWVAPEDGGADISDYVVQSCTASNVCTDFAHTASAIETITVTGLATGSPFTFKVAAKNAAGTSGFSPNSGPAIPQVVPDAPISISATANASGGVEVKWSAPAKDGGNVISDYDVQSCISTTCTSFVKSSASAVTTQTVTALQTGTAYTFKVAAINAAGTGAYSTPTQSAVTPYVKPYAPTEVKATANNTGGIAVTWKAPVNTGGIAISDYDVQSCISTTCTSFARASASALLTQTVTGLTKGTAYTFKVAAINTAGTGLYSLPSDPATPRVVPGAVSNIAGIPGDDKVDLLWTAPTDNGGSSITSYSVAFSSDAGSSWSQDQSASTNSLSVTGLSGGTIYLFRVAANNAAGKGADATSSAIHTNPFVCAPTRTISGLNVVMTFSKVGICVWTVPTDVSSLDTLIMGGGGGASAGNSGAGGGAASVVSGIAVVPGASLYITVGQGGVAGASSPAVSATPGFSSGIAIGAKSYVSNGGAASTSTSAGAGGTSTSGFAGGIGGTSALGKSGTNSYITGTATVYGSGGAGTASASGTAGAANTGNGGGSGTGAGGAGGSGVALLRFAAAPVNAFPSFIGQPFARYVASDYQTTDSTRKTWVDSSGNNRPAISVGGTPGVSAITGNGAGSVVSVTGGTSDSVRFPDAVLPSTYTLFHVARYSGANKGRIFNSASNAIYSTGWGRVCISNCDEVNWLSGFWGGGVAMAYHNGWVAPYEPRNANTNWQLSSDQNTVYRANGKSYTISNSGYVNGTMTINAGMYGEYSDWNVAEVLVYNKALSIAEIQQVENYLARTYGLKGTTIAGADLGVLQAKNIKGVQKTEQGITVSWNAASDSTNLVDYTLEYSTDNTNWTTVTRTASTATSFDVTGLSPTQKYAFRVTPSYGNVTNEQTDAGNQVVGINTRSAVPTEVTAVADDIGGVIVKWTRPVDAGNSSITDYDIQSCTGSPSVCTPITHRPSDVTELVVKTLLKGTSYTFKVAAINTAGSSDFSLPSTPPVAPRTKPGVPTVSGKVDDKGGVVVTWIAPTNNGGNAISEYVLQSCVVANPCAAVTGVTIASGMTVTGLTPGTAYTFKVAAVNAAGSGDPGESSPAVIPRRAPDAPTVVEAKADNTGGVVVKWIAPVNNGGNAISGYVLQSCAGEICAAVTGVTITSGMTVTGLFKGTGYTFQVAAVNAAGMGAYSSKSLPPVTPRAAPGIPDNISGILGDGQVTLSWTAPADNGSPISNYIVQSCTNNSTICSPVVRAVSPTPSQIVTKLSNGTPYTFKVQAVNEAGPSSAITSLPYTPRRAPDAPTGVTATVDDKGGVTVEWKAPTGAGTGGNDISDYDIQSCTVSPVVCGSVPHGPPLATKLVATLTKGTFYTFTVAAKNTAGLGAYSLPSTAAVAPRTSPDAPSITTVTADSTGGVVITWLAPSFNGGSAITEYVPDLALAGVAWGQWDASKHKFKVNSDGLSAVVTGLTLGTRYHIGLRAKNAAGVSLLDDCPSTPNLTEVGGCVVIPRTKPGVPTVSGVVNDKGGVVVTWIAPANNGNAISEYVLQLCEGVMPCAAFADARFASGTTVTGLTPGKTYTFKVAAVNAAGPGDPGESGEVIPRRAPDAPNGVEAKADNTGGVEVKWTAPVNNGGNAISGYVLESCEGTKPCVAFTPTGVTIASGMTVTGLVKGTGYTFQVAAVNAAGTGVPSPKSSPPVTPRAAPGIPDKISGKEGNTQVVLTWTAPADNGSPISNYIVQSCTNNSTICSPVVRAVSPTPSQIVTNLSNGTPYTFKVQAVNEAGSSSAITSLPYTPRRAPDAPTDVEAKADNTGGVEVKWTAPTNNGGSPITGYTVQSCVSNRMHGDPTPGSSSDPIWFIWYSDCLSTTSTSITATSVKVTGLTQGTAYSFQVAATNAAGAGVYSAKSSPAVTPRAVPGIPVNFRATADDKRANLSWDPPVSNGGEAIDYYIVQLCRPTCAVFTQVVSPKTSITVTGLSNGTGYTFKVAAHNIAGKGDDATSGGPTTPRTVAGAPLGVSGTPGDKQVQLQWSAPLETGGATVTDYVVQYCTTTECKTFVHNASPKTLITVTGLKNGVGYQFQVAAVNDAQAGSYSARSSEITPRTVPGVPTSATAVANKFGGVDVSWSAPTSDGGAAISDYLITICGGTSGTNCTGYGVDIKTDNKLTFTVPETSSRTMVGFKWSFLVRAVNEAGPGNQTSLIGPVDPYRAPNAPSSAPVATVDDKGGVSVTWVAPNANGATISGYIVKYCTGVECKPYGTEFKTSPASIAGLIKGIPYTFKVAANNAAGIGADSVESNKVTPRSAPEPPTNATALANSTGGVVVQWIAPTDNGGNAITDYTVQSCVGVTCTSFARNSVATALLQTVTGLEKGKIYTFKVAAVNAAGPSSFADAAGPATPRAKSGDPTDLSGRAENAQVSLTWKAPSETNGSPISNYIVQSCTNNSTICSPVVRVVSPTASQIVPNLSNGTPYTFKVAAVNEAGISNYVTSLPYTPRTVPDAPITVTATADKEGGVDVLWSAPLFNGGSIITGYTVQSCEGAMPCATFTPSSPLSAASTSVKVLRLNKGTSYTFQVAAVNIAGTGSFAKASGSGATPSTAPGIPAQPTAEVDDFGGVTVKWSAPDNGGDKIIDYDIQSCPPSPSVCAPITHTPSDVTQLVVTTLTKGTPYTFKVAAKNIAGSSTFSLPSTPAVAPRTKPGVPTVSGKVDDKGGVVVTWIAPANNGNAISEYVLQLCEGVMPCAAFADARFASGTTVTGLTPGKTYTFKVAAVNAAGPGEFGESGKVIPRRAPDAPNGVEAKADNTGGVEVKWIAPAANGDPISGYVLQSCEVAKPCAAVTGVTITSGMTVTGLTKGTSYSFQVAAVNAAGTGVPSPKSSPPVTPRAAPGIPDKISGKEGNTQVVLTWTAPADNGSPISNYIVQSCTNNSTICSPVVRAVSPTPSQIVTNLSNGTPYTFKVQAVNEAGSSSAITSLPYTPRRAPDAPTDVEAKADNTGGVEVKWTAPTNNGGSPITGYTVQSCVSNRMHGDPTPGSSSDPIWFIWYSDCLSTTSTSITATSVKVTGLTQGTAYSFQVAATNAAGAGVYSAKSSPAVTPRAVPGIPVNFRATADDKRANLSWDPPVSNGGEAIDYYIVQLCRPTCAVFTQVVSPKTSITVTGLSNGTGYTFKVAAHNIAGKGDDATSGGPTTPRTVAGAPLGVSGTPGDKQVQLQWSAPLETGGATVTDYVVQYCTTTECKTFVHNASPKTLITVTGLKNGVGYQFQVAAVNDAQAGSYSARSSEITPRTVPGVPTSATAVANKFGGVDVSWSAPTSDGGAAISDYLITICGGTSGTNCTGYGVDIKTDNKLTFTVPETSSRTMVGFKWSFLVRAVNEAGPGNQTSLIGPVDPYRAPNAPSSAPVATVDDKGGVSVTWVAPNANGATISGYIVKYCTGVECKPYGTEFKTSPASIAGLIKGIPYTFKVAANNAAGIGADSVESNKVTPRSAPEPPTNATALANSTGGVVVQWIAPTDNGGNAITDYTVQSCVGVTCTSFARNSVATALLQTVTGLEKGKIYTFKVAAVNAAGPSSFADAAGPATPRAKSGDPTDLSGRAENAQVSLTWKAPSETNGSPISNYIVQSCTNNSTICSPVVRVVSPTASQIVPNLSNGTPYTFKVAAVNEAGISNYVTSLPYTPRTVPDAPITVTATADKEGGVDVLWSAPLFNGGSIITGYTVQSCEGAMPCATFTPSSPLSAASTSVKVLRLNKGTSYTFQVAAVNIAGTGSFAKASGSGATPSTAPGIPAQPTAEVDDFGGVTVKWSAPDNGGDKIIDYDIQSCPPSPSVCAPITHTPSDVTQLVVTTLTKGTPYTFKVAAKNIAGSSTFSLPSTPAVAPRTKPGVPTVSGKVDNTGGVVVTWIAPANNGNAISEYVLQSCEVAKPCSVVTGVTIASGMTVTGLTTGTPYTFKVAAKNAAGPGDPGESSPAVIPRRAPDAPTVVEAKADNTGGVVVKWIAPAANGDPISGYVLQSCAGEICAAVTGVTITSGMTVTGLFKGTGYTFQVAAVNAANTGAFSAKSLPAVTPRAAPDIVTNISGKEGNTQVVLTWTAPANNGDAITDYVVQACDGSLCSTFAQDASAGKITICHANASGGFLELTVDRNSLNGHGDHSSDIIPAPPTGCPSSTKVAISTTLPPAPAVVGITVTGLSNGVPYTFKVTAKNAAGTGEAGVSAFYTPRRAPDAPTGVEAKADNTGGVGVSWTVPLFNGGSVITDYVVEYATATTDYVVFADGVGTGTSAKVTGLTPGVEYTFRVAAKNIAGQGAYSAESLEAIAIARTVPGAPTATASSTRDSAIELEWKFVAPETDGGSEITQYDVEWAKIGTSDWSRAAYNFRTTRIEGLEIGKQYKFRTTASNDAGAGRYSAEVVAIPQKPPKSVTNLTYQLTSSSGIQTLTLNWKAPLDTGGAPLTKYNFAYCIGVSESCKTKTSMYSRNNVLATTTSFIVAPGNYRYYVASVNDAGVEECADPKQIKCGTSISVDVAG